MQLNVFIISEDIKYFTRSLFVTAERLKPQLVFSAYVLIFHFVFFCHLHRSVCHPSINGPLASCVQIHSGHTKCGTASLQGALI